MPIATGIFKQLRYKKETVLGTAPGATGAQLLRRVTSNLDLKKETYKSNEIRTDAQRSDFRHGVRSVDGSINGELSCGTYKDFMSSVLRQAWQAPSTTGAIITVAAAVTSGAAGTFTRSGGSYLTDGFKIGDVVRWTGWATTGLPNNTHNFLITALTALVMTGVMLDGVAVGAKIAGDTVTGVVVGKKTWIPTTGHTNESYSIEHYFGDLVQSELFLGCRPGKMDVKLPGSGMATVDFAFMGLNMTTAGAEYFTTPTAASTGGVLAAVNGALYIAGVAVGLITGMNIEVNPNLSDPGGVVGSNSKPDIFVGSLDVTGQMTVLFDSVTYRDYFVNETEVSVNAVFTAANTAAADFIAFSMPRVKVGGASKNDGETGLILTMPFTALLNTAGGAAVSTLATTISIQDSLAT